MHILEYPSKMLYISITVIVHLQTVTVSWQLMISYPADMVGVKYRKGVVFAHLRRQDVSTKSSSREDLLFFVE